jgi:hypothetical protein
MRRAALPAGIVLFAAVFFAPELFGGRLAVTGNLQRWLPWATDATPEQIAAPSVSLDCNLSYYPRRVILHRAWRDGRIPFWNPYSFCGTPFLADVQAGVLYPPNWLLLPLDPGKQLGWFLFLHAAWAGIGVLVLARARGAPPGLALLAGCAWALNGFFAKHFGQPTFLATAAWMPWVVHLAIVAVRRPGPGSAARLALAGAMTFLAGQPQLALLTAYAALLAAGTARWADAPPEGGRPHPVRVAAALAAAGALAALLVAAQLLPTRALAALSERAELPYSTIVSGAMHPAEWVRFLVPEFFGTPLTGDEWSTLFPRGDGFYLRNQMNSVFAGTPLFLLALWGMAGPRTWRRSLPFTVLFAAGCLLAFGSPLARLAYEALPGFRFSRIDRAGSVVALAQVVPAALAAADLARARGAGRRVFGAVALLLAVGGALLVTLRGPAIAALLGADAARLPAGGLDAARVAHLVSRTWVAALFAVGTGVAFLLPPSWLASRLPVALACAQLFLFAAPYRLDRDPADVFPPAPGIDTLRSALADGAGGGRFVRFRRDMPLRPYPLSSVLPPSTNVPYGLRDLQGYNALADRKLGEALETALGEPVFSHGIWSGRRIVAPEREASLEHPLLDALAVRAAVSGSAFRAAGWTALPSAGFYLAMNTEAAPRVRLLPAGRGVPPGHMAALLRGGGVDWKHEAVWVGSGRVEPEPDGDAETGAAGRAGPAGSAEVLEDSWNDLAVRIRAGTRAVLVVADAHDAGWRATVDGAAAPVLPVYGLVRGVIVPAGDHVVRMRYRPPGFVWGVVLSLFGLLLTGTALALARD